LFALLEVPHPDPLPLTRERGDLLRLPPATEAAIKPLFAVFLNLLADLVCGT
jgi:hypothetical protein